MSNPITAETTRKIAKLSRLKLSDDEINRFTQELGSILKYVEQLQAIDTNGVEPLIHGVELADHFRKDEAKPLSEEDIKAILSCSDQVLYEQYKVPQVIGES